MLGPILCRAFQRMPTFQEYLRQSKNISTWSWKKAGSIPFGAFVSPFDSGSKLKFWIFILNAHLQNCDLDTFIFKHWIWNIVFQFLKVIIIVWKSAITVESGVSSLFSDSWHPDFCPNPTVHLQAFPQFQRDQCMLNAWSDLWFRFNYVDQIGLGRSATWK